MVKISLNDLHNDLQPVGIEGLTIIDTLVWMIGDKTNIASTFSPNRAAIPPDIHVNDLLYDRPYGQPHGSLSHQHRGCPGLSG